MHVRALLGAALGATALVAPTGASALSAPKPPATCVVNGHTTYGPQTAGQDVTVQASAAICADTTLVSLTLHPMSLSVTARDITGDCDSGAGAGLATISYSNAGSSSVDLSLAFSAHTIQGVGYVSSGSLKGWRVGLTMSGADAPAAAQDADIVGKLSRQMPTGAPLAANVCGRTTNRVVLSAGVLTFTPSTDSVDSSDAVEDCLDGGVTAAGTDTEPISIEDPTGAPAGIHATPDCSLSYTPIGTVGTAMGIGDSAVRPHADTALSTAFTAIDGTGSGTRGKHCSESYGYRLGDRYPAQFKKQGSGPVVTLYNTTSQPQSGSDTTTVGYDVGVAISASVEFSESAIIASVKETFGITLSAGKSWSESITGTVNAAPHTRAELWRGTSMFKADGTKTFTDEDCYVSTVGTFQVTGDQMRDSDHATVACQPK